MELVELLKESNVMNNILANFNSKSKLSNMGTLLIQENFIKSHINP